MVQDTNRVEDINEKRLNELNNYLSVALYSIRSWQLEESYQNLESIDMLLSGVLPKQHGEAVENLFKQIEQIRRKIRDSESESEEQELNIKLRHLLKKLFEVFNSGCVEQNLYFKKGRDPRFATIKQ